MLVKFIDKENPQILLEIDYSDVTPLIEMIKQKAVIYLFLDRDGDKRVNGRLYDFEYSIELETGAIKESLLVIIDCNYNNAMN